MDRLSTCIDALRILARQSANPNTIPLIEREINEYVRVGESDRPASLERLNSAIRVEEAAQRQGEDWTIVSEYIQSLSGWGVE